MRLGFVITEGRGELDSLLADVARHLTDAGWRLGGVVQVNVDRPGQRCDMELVVLGGADRIRISQSLGPMARGCRLDPLGLEAAAGQVAAMLGKDPPQLLIVNKFGKAEAGGRGFRPVIGLALAAGVPVLLGVNRANLDGFDAFTAGLGELLPANTADVLSWCARLSAPDFDR